METPEFLQGGYCNTHFTPEKRHSDNKPGDHFIIEDLLLDYPNDDDAIVSEGTLNTVTGISTDSSSITVVDSCSSSVSGSEPHFSGDVGCRRVAESQFSSDLCVPDDDLAELEWLSNLVEESFSSEDLQKLQLISGTKARTHEASEARDFRGGTFRNATMFQVPGKARSKRSRAAPCNWTSRLLVLSPTRTRSTSPESDIVPGSGKKPVKARPKKKEDADNATAAVGGSDGRKCLHCATDKTPQWRTGPMGPKTLCNACGVRYKSGRLVPEYRPAASPTFMLTEHSNSHRKVLELRRQKELQMAKHQHQQFLHHQSMIFDLSNGDDYLIHQHMGPDFRQLI